MCSSSPAPAPSSQTVTQTSIPDYAKPYVENMLGKTEALTNSPTPIYPGQQNAHFTGLQQQAQSAVGGMMPSAQIGAATGLANQAGLGALNAQYNAPTLQANQFGQSDAQQYMSPYMQGVVNVQQQEAQRQADIAGTQRNAQATGAGAFGGSRQPNRALSKPPACRTRSRRLSHSSMLTKAVRCRPTSLMLNSSSMARVLVCRVFKRLRKQRGSLALSGRRTTRRTWASTNCNSRRAQRSSNSNSGCSTPSTKTTCASSRLLISS
jgi:hypothetical protein